MYCNILSPIKKRFQKRFWEMGWVKKYSALSWMYRGTLILIKSSCTWYQMRLEKQNQNFFLKPRSEEMDTLSWEKWVRWPNKWEQINKSNETILTFCAYYHWKKHEPKLALFSLKSHICTFQLLIHYNGICDKWGICCASFFFLSYNYVNENIFSQKGIYSHTLKE